MSGGAAVKAGGGVEGDHPVCTTLLRRSNAEAAMNKKTGGRPGIRPAPPLKGLGLDSPGTQSPQKKTRY